MIQPNEIRIGNWVNLDVIPYQITEIKNDCVSARYYPNKAVTLGTQYYIEETDITYNLLFPIPLTEEILLKCGFEKYKMLGYDTHFTYSLFIGGETINITAIYNADFSIMLHGLARGIKYLHRLQNIINIITGNDLEINL